MRMTKPVHQALLLLRKASQPVRMIPDPNHQGYGDAPMVPVARPFSESDVAAARLALSDISGLELVEMIQDSRRDGQLHHYF